MPAAQDFCNSPDIVCYFLDHAYNEAKGVFPGCLGINRQFYDFGKLILRRDIRVCPRNARAFFSALQILRPDVLALIRSITIVGNKRIAERRPLSRSISGHQILPGIGKWLPKMPNLGTISCSKFMYVPGRLESCSRRGISEYFESLAYTSIKDLEIQYTQIEFSDEPPQKHFCLVLNQLMLRLRRLRVSQTKICPMLMQSFSDNCGNLEELILNIDNCGINRDCTSLIPNPQATREAAVKKLVDYAVDAMKLGRFPKLTHFVVCGTRRGPGNLSYHDGIFSCLLVYTIDLLRRTTTVYPTAVATHSTNYATRSFVYRGDYGDRLG